MAHPVAPGQVQGHLLLARVRVVEVDHGPTQGRGLFLDLLFDPPGRFLGQGHKVLEQDVLKAQEAAQATEVGQQALGAAEADAVKAAENTVDPGAEALYKGLHGCLPGLWCID